MEIVILSKMCFCQVKTFILLSRTGKRLQQKATQIMAAEQKAKKGGRPPKEAQERKSFKIELKLSQADYAHLDTLFQHSGYRKRSDMYHDMLFHTTLKQRDPDTLVLLKAVHDLVRELKAIGADYQEVTARVSQAFDPDSLPPACRQLSDLSRQLQEKQNDMFAIILKLRDIWLRES